MMMKNLLIFTCLCCVVSVFGQKTALKNPPSARFSDKYVKDKRGGFSIESSDVQELLHIIIALTPTGLRDSNLIDHTSIYYKKVLKHFQKFENEPLVATINDFLKQGQYSRLRMNSCAFSFDNEHLSSNTVYFKLHSETENPVKNLLSQLEAFAEKSQFRQFFNENSAYLNMNRNLIQKFTPIPKQWNWLEQHFDSRFDAYKILFSPLANGIHTSHVFEDNAFREMLVFVGAPFRNPAWNESVTEGLNSRFIFTEMVQNYLTNNLKTHQERIETAFSDPTRWAFQNFVASKDDTHQLFKKQLAWAVFTLYCYDNFKNEADFKALNERTERLMTQFRGYKNFAAFNAKLLELYKNTADKKIEPLIPTLLEWAVSQEFVSKY